MKHFKSLSAATAASVLALSMVAMPVFADGEDQINYDSSILFNTTVTETEAANGVTLPQNVKFNYSVIYDETTMTTDFLGQTGTFTALKNLVSTKINSSSTSANDLAITVEPLTNEFSVDITNGAITNKTEKDDQNQDKIVGHFYGSTMNIKLNQNNISTPGYYFFELKENDHQVGNTTTEVDGVDRDDDQKVIVAVMLTHPEIKDSDGNGTGEYDLDTYEVGQVIWYEYTTENQLNKIFDTVDGHLPSGNQNESYFTAEYKTYPLTIKKMVTGNLGEKNKSFTINYSISSNANYEKTLPLTWNGPTGKAESVTNQGAYPANSDKTAELANEQSVTIHGLAANDLVKVWETFTDNTADGYTVSYIKTANGAATGTKINTSMNKSGTKENATDVIGGENTADATLDLSNSYTVTVNNDKSGSPITGIVHNYGPFALMAAIGAGLIGFFFRRRREE